MLRNYMNYAENFNLFCLLVNSKPLVKISKDVRNRSGPNSENNVVVMRDCHSYKL